MSSIEESESLNSLSHNGLEDVVSTGLPSLVTAADVREVVRFLRQRPEGIPLMEASEAFRKRFLDSRKLLAYESWGIVAKVGNRLTLVDLGREFAARLSPEIEIYREILRRTRPYHAALEWFDRSELELATCEEVDSFWFRNYPDSIDRSLGEGQATSFFDLCHAAEIGQTTNGRKGHPARLRLYRHELSAYLADQASQLFVPGSTVKQGPGSKSSIQGQVLPVLARQVRIRMVPPQRVFVSHHSDVIFGPQLKAAFDLAEIECAFSVRDANEDMQSLLPFLAAMKQCDSAFIVITKQDCLDNSGNESQVDQQLMVEIGAAVAQFRERVVLLAQRGIRLPRSLQNLACFEFEGDLLPWDTLIEINKRLKTLITGGNGVQTR